LRSALQSYKKHRELILTEANEEPDLTGVDWKYEYGLVAQDLEAQGLNHFVHTKISYLEFVPILIQRVKELEAMMREEGSGIFEEIARSLRGTPWQKISQSWACNSPPVESR